MDGFAPTWPEGCKHLKDPVLSDGKTIRTSVEGPGA